MSRYQDCLQLAFRAHKDQFRKYSGLPYIQHPIEVAALSQQYLDRNCNSVIVCAALLHDVIEDCPHITEEMIEDVGGKDVLNLVKELTNPSKGSKLSRAERKKMDRLHLKDVSEDAKAIKIIDRTCNLRDMVEADDDFRKIYLEESRLLYPVLVQDYTGDIVNLFNIALDELESTLS